MNRWLRKWKQNLEQFREFGVNLPNSEIQVSVPCNRDTHSYCSKAGPAWLSVAARERWFRRDEGAGTKTVGKHRENLTVLATVFFGRERKRERENRTGKRNRYYGISGTESIGREHADYDRESITQNGKIHTTTSNI